MWRVQRRDGRQGRLPEQGRAHERRAQGGGRAEPLPVVRARRADSTSVAEELAFLPILKVSALSMIMTDQTRQRLLLTDVFTPRSQVFLYIFHPRARRSETGAGMYPTCSVAVFVFFTWLSNMYFWNPMALGLYLE